MLALQSFFALIFALGLVTAAPFAQCNCTSKCIEELAKLGKDLFKGYEKATGITANETDYYAAEVPGLPKCTSHGCHKICDTLPVFTKVFEDFNSSLNDDIMNQNHKTPLVTIISKILETQYYHFKTPDRLPQLPHPRPDLLTRKIMFYNAFRNYKNCAEKAKSDCPLHRRHS